MPTRTRLIAAIAIVHLAAGIGHAQPTELDSVAQRPHRIATADYPTPLPAAVLSIGSHGILDAVEPSTVRSVSVGVHTHFDAGNGSVQGVGLEIAPLLLGDGVTLGDYLSGRLFRLLIRPRVSLAFASSDGALDVALGLRWMLHDDADLRADSTLLVVASRASPELRAKVLDSARSALADRMWNRSVFELAITSTMHGDGASEPSSLSVNGYQTYFSIAEPFAGHRARAMLGLAGGLTRSAAEYEVSGGVTLRGEYGARTERLILGVRYLWPPGSSSGMVFDAGGLLRVADGLWLRPGIVIPVKASSIIRAQGVLAICLGAPVESGR